MLQKLSLFCPAHVSVITYISICTYTYVQLKGNTMFNNVYYFTCVIVHIHTSTHTYVCRCVDPHSHTCTYISFIHMRTKIPTRWAELPVPKPLNRCNFTTGQTVELEWTWVVLADAMGWAHQVGFVCVCVYMNICIYVCVHT